MTTLHHYQRTDRLDSNYVVLWAEDAAIVDQYGAYHCQVSDDLCTIDMRDESTREMIRVAAADDYMSPDYALDDDMLNPPDIVESAGAWDDPDFVFWAWDALGVAFARTHNGAALVHWSAIDTSRVAVCAQ